MKKSIILILSIWMFASCGGGDQSGQSSSGEKPAVQETSANVDPMKNKGIGPVDHVELGGIDEDMVAAGKQIFEEKCTACHKVDKKFIGPSVGGVTERRTPEWIMNMILNPVEMVQKDPIAKQLLIEANGAPMADQNLTEEEARSVLEYFRTLN